WRVVDGDRRTTIGLVYAKLEAAKKIREVSPWYTHLVLDVVEERWDQQMSRVEDVQMEQLSVFGPGTYYWNHYDSSLDLGFRFGYVLGLAYLDGLWLYLVFGFDIFWDCIWFWTELSYELEFGFDRAYLCGLPAMVLNLNLEMANLCACLSKRQKRIRAMQKKNFGVHGMDGYGVSVERTVGGVRSSWAAVLEKRDALHFPADLYLEGTDQHRGWFQSSLLTSVATKGKAPYACVITHGFVLDEKGMKMSKSLGNIVDPEVVIIGGKSQKDAPGYGADVLRLWVSSVDYTGDVMIGPQVLRQMSDIYRKLRGTLRYLLSNLHDWKPEYAVSYDDLSKIDKYALFQLENVTNVIKESYENYQFYKIFQILQRFAIVDLSNFYFDVAKDRLYVGGTESFTRRSCQTVLSAHLLTMARIIAPILPHLAEDAWQHLPFEHSTEDGYVAKFVFESKWPDSNKKWLQMAAEDIDFWRKILELRGEVNKVLEDARIGKLIGSSLEAKVYLHTADASAASRLQELCEAKNDADALHRIFITSQVEVLSSLEGETIVDIPYVGELTEEGSSRIWIGVSRADGMKCERCWNYSHKVGSFVEHPTLCERCHNVIMRLQPLGAMAGVG
ncbi:hypothetical protein Taro_028443, partial [Colocasia esculenta]|nr:hypothetical protein [Colocasia esculenta]